MFYNPKWPVTTHSLMSDLSLAHPSPSLIVLSISLFCRKTKYLEVTLYHAYYSFESLLHRSPSDLVCGVCGATPDILFGKRNSLYLAVCNLSHSRRYQQKIVYCTIFRDNYQIISSIVLSRFISWSLLRITDDNN